MIAIASLLIVVTLSILVTRVATVALTHTGMSREAARFQARSAFTGAGFTTQEAEMVVNHPIRRRIVLLLMLLGNAGIVTAVSSLMLGFVNESTSSSFWVKIVSLAGGIGLLWYLASSKWVDRYLSRLIDWMLRRFTRLEVTDYASLLRLKGDYRLGEIEMQEDDWLTGQTLREANLRQEGVNVLGITRGDGNYMGAPTGETQVKAGDVLIVYGREECLQEIDERRHGTSGDREHDEAVAEQDQVEQAEAAEDRGQGG